MNHPKFSRKKASALFTLLFIAGLTICVITETTWWPTIMLAIGIPFSFRQYLLGKYYDMTVALFVFVGAFVTVTFNIPWKLLLPILFTIGAIYIFFREFFGTQGVSEEEKYEDTNEEIEESKKRK